MLNNKKLKSILVGGYPLKESMDDPMVDSDFFADSFANSFFPVIEGTPYEREDYSIPANWLEIYDCLRKKILKYEEHCEYMLSRELTKDMFHNHALFLMKASLRAFSPYTAKAEKLLKKLEQMESSFYLERFINAQDYGGKQGDMSDYKTALEEIKAGNKKTHWIWYIFPQMRGLGKSEISDFYGIDGREEAYAYMEHPVLSKRLIEATEAVLNNEHTPYEIFGQDTIKFRSCMLLFSTVSDHPVFKKILQKYKW